MEEKIKRIEKESVNKNIILTRNIYLRSLALIYLMSFMSLYFQIQGLWGDEGLLPAGNLLKKLSENFKQKANFKNFPALLWFSNDINNFFIKFINFTGLSSVFKHVSSSHIDNTLYLLCLIGILISLSIALNSSYTYNPIGFLLIWLIYLNFFIIGQVFMSYQWDVLLLEVGFLSIFICPILKSRLCFITPIDNLIFNLLKFLMFRFMYSNGILKITADCPFWLSFTALHHHFQSQPLPNLLSYYAHFLSDGVKKMLVAESLFIEIYIPFLIFLFHRRFTIFAGMLINCLQLGIIFTGNYNFFNFLTIVLNLTLFDDQLLRSFIPKFILNSFDLDPLKDVDDYIKTKSKNDTNNEFTPLNEDENENEGKENKEITEEEKQEKLFAILRNTKLRNISEDDEDTYINKYPESLFYQKVIFTEIMFFLNFFAISLIFTFFFLYPLKELLQGTLILKIESINNIFNKNFLNFYMIFVFFYITFLFFRDLIQVIKINLEESTTKGVINNLINFVLSLVQAFKYFLFATLSCLLFLNSVNVFYTSLDLKLNTGSENTLLGQGIHISDFMFTRLRVNHGYGLFRKMTGAGGRPELEIKMLDSEDNEWEDLYFPYKMNDGDQFKLKINIPHQPRVDWQVWFASLANDINTEPWLVIMLGKLLEKNPVILDLLGYKIHQKEFYYNSNIFYLNQNLDSLIDKLFNSVKPKLLFTPKKIKIDSFNYYFNKISEVKKGKFWIKKFNKIFLPSIEKFHLKDIFSVYGLPAIDETRNILVSPFALLPIYDIVALISFIYLYFILNKKKY